MKNYRLVVHTGDEVMVVSVDAPRLNLAYHFISAGCQSGLPGFGDAKSIKLYRLFEAGGGVLEFSQAGVKTRVELEIS